MQQTDLAEGLESTLVMLAHRIPADVTIVRDYGADVPRIEALAAELNQVWTNLIDNALDAMDGRGTLRVSTRVDRGEVVVEIGDTGAGMSPETEEHAFDPFYTTKGVGEGTGLGLDISRRIVDRHKGDISVQTRPGETVLRVRLPARGADTAPRVSSAGRALASPAAHECSGGTRHARSSSHLARRMSRARARLCAGCARTSSSRHGQARQRARPPRVCDGCDGCPSE